jgi:hypothetical protein
MDVKAIQVHENVCQCLDQPFGSPTPKSHKKQMVHKESPISSKHSICAPRKKRGNSNLC